MITIYDSMTTIGNFDNNGLVVLSDCFSFVTSEKNNDTYEVAMEYPIDDAGKWQYILENNILKNSSGQLFRIYHKAVTETSVTANARCIFYDLIDNMILSLTTTSLTGSASLTEVFNNTAYPHPFTCLCDLQGSASLAITQQNPIDAIMSTGGVIANFGGEIVRDNFEISLLEARGESNGVLISYGKNIVGITEDLDEDTICTRALIVGGNGLMLPELYIDSPYIGNYPNPKIKIVSFSDIQEDDTNGITQAMAIVNLRAAGVNYMATSGCDIPPFTYTVNFLELANTIQYEDYSCLETVNMCDTVIIKHERLNMDLSAKVIEIDFDDLTGMIQNVVLGSFQSDIASVLNNSLNAIQQSVVQVTSDYQNAIDTMSSLITGGTGGNLVIQRNANGQPYELDIMDTTSASTCQNVWRFNSGGLAHSSTGFSGEFTVGMTMDGHIAGSIIEALTVNAGDINAGGVINGCSINQVIGGQIVNEFTNDAFGGLTQMYDLDGNLQSSIGCISGTGNNVGGSITLFRDGDHPTVMISATEAKEAGFVTLCDFNGTLRVSIEGKDVNNSSSITLTDTNNVVQSYLNESTGCIGGQLIATEQYVLNAGRDWYFSWAGSMPNGAAGYVITHNLGHPAICVFSATNVGTYILSHSDTDNTTTIFNSASSAGTWSGTVRLY